MISVNCVVGTFTDITSTEQVIPVPNAQKIVFKVDGMALDISINDNQHYITYDYSDDIIEFCNDPSNSLYITKIYVKTCVERGFTTGGEMRIWALK